jgi:hypothetical protein
MLKYNYTTDLNLDDSYSVIAEITDDIIGFIGSIYKKSNGEYYIEIYPTDKNIIINATEVLDIINKVKADLADYKFTN